MKLKDLKGFPKKMNEKEFGCSDRLPVITFNQALEQAGNIDLELDVKKIEEILNQDLPYFENRVHADIIRNNNKTYARVIADNFKEIIKK